MFQISAIFPLAKQMKVIDVKLTQAMLANPTKALPHYPLVTHRGGWPDGS